MADQQLSFLIRILGVEGAAQATQQVSAGLLGIGRSAAQATPALVSVDDVSKSLAASLGRLQAQKIQLDASAIRQFGNELTQLRAVVSRGGQSSLGLDAKQLAPFRSQIAQITVDARRLQAEMRAIGQAPVSPAQVEKLNARMAELRDRAVATRGAMQQITGANIGALGGAATRAAGPVGRLQQQMAFLAASGVAGVPVLGQLATSMVALGVVAAPVVAGLAALAFGIFAVKEAAEAEQGIKKLNVALQSTGSFSTQASAEMRRFAASMQTMTGESDDAVIGIEAVLAQIGRLRGEDLERATIATLDLAAALGTDLQNAALLVGKAAAGSTEALSRYGIILEEGLSPAQKFEAALSQIEDKFGGTAAANLDSYAGSIKLLKNNWSDFLEGVGTRAIPVLTKITRAAADAIAAHTQEGQSLDSASGAIDRYVESLKKMQAGYKGLSLDEFNAAMKDVSFGLSDETVAQIRVELRQGNTEAIKRTLDSLGQAIDVAMEIKAPATREARLAELREFKRLAEEALTLKMRIETRQVDEALRALQSKLRPQTLATAIQVDNRAIQESVRLMREQLLQFGPVEIVPTGLDALEAAVQAEQDRIGELGVLIAPHLDANAVSDAIRSIEGDAANVARLKAIIEVEVPKMDESELKIASAALTENLANAAKEGTDKSNALAEALLPVVQRYKELEKIRLSEVLQAPALGPLNALVETLRNIKAEATDIPSDALEATFAEPLRDMNEAARQAQEQLRAVFETTATASTLQAAVEGVVSTFRDLATEVPQFGYAFRALADSIEREFRPQLEVRLNAEATKRDARAIADTSISILKTIKAPPLVIAAAEEQAGKIESVTESVEMMTAALARVDEATPEAQLQAYSQLASQIAATERAAEKLGATVREQQERARAALAPGAGVEAKRVEAGTIVQEITAALNRQSFDEVEDAIIRLADLADETQDVEIRAMLRLETGESGRFRQEILRVQRDAVIEIEARLDPRRKKATVYEINGLVRTLQDAGDVELRGLDSRTLGRILDLARNSPAGEAAGTELGKRFRESFDLEIGQILFTGISDGFAAVGEAIILRTQQVGDAIVSVIEVMIKSALAALARFAAKKLIGAIPGLGFLAPFLSTSGPTPTQAPAEAAKVIPPPAALLRLEAPEIVFDQPVVDPVRVKVPILVETPVEDTRVARRARERETGAGLSKVASGLGMTRAPAGAAVQPPSLDLRPLEKLLDRFATLGPPALDLRELEAALGRERAAPEVDLRPLEEILGRGPGVPAPAVDLRPLEAALARSRQVPDLDLGPLEAALRRRATAEAPSLDLSGLERSLAVLGEQAAAIARPSIQRARGTALGEIAPERAALRLARGSGLGALAPEPSGLTEFLRSRQAAAATALRVDRREEDIARRFDPGRQPTERPVSITVQTESVRTLANSIRRGPLSRAFRSLARSGRAVGSPR